MSEISFDVDVRAIRDELQAEGGRYVKLISGNRKNACIEAVGDVLDENGYLPEGTTYEAWRNACWFSVDKGTGADLAHYFHEGQIYGPNMFIRKLDEWRSPAGKPKSPTGRYLNQYPGSSLGVRHWTEAVQPGGPLYYQFIERCEEILRK